MPQITRNSGFSTQDIVTATKLHNLVDTAVISKELLTAQTLLTYGTVAANDYLLGYDVSDTSMRTISVENILNSKISTTLGATQIEGRLDVFTNENNSSLAINTDLGTPVFKVDGFDQLTFDSNSTVLNTDSLLLTIENDDSKKVLEYKFWEDESGEREERDITIDIKHPASTNADSRTYLTTDNKTVVDFKGPVTHTGSLTLVSPEITIGTGEDAETVDLLNPPSLGVFDIVFDTFVEPTGTTQLRLGSLAAVAESGTLILNQSITVPEGEIWLVEYHVFHAGNTDDNWSVVFKRGDTLVYSFSPAPRTHPQLRAAFRLEAGTYQITSRTAIFNGSNYDIITYNLSPIQRTIYKIRV